MRRSTFALLILPLAIAACGATAPAPSGSPDASAPPSSAVKPRPKGAVIDMQNDAYTPKDVTISVGGTVAFINRGTEKRQPMPDPHPEHTGIAGFLSPEIPEGSTFSFTFAEAGSYSYHDEMNPSITGTITVE